MKESRVRLYASALGAVGIQAESLAIVQLIVKTVNEVNGKGDQFSLRDAASLIVDCKANIKKEEAKEKQV